MALIKLVKKHQEDIETKVKKNVWERIAKIIFATLKVSYTVTQVDTKWKGLVKTYKEYKKQEIKKLIP